MMTTKNNRQCLDKIRQGPEDSSNDKKDTQLDDVPTEQRRGPNNGIYNDMTKDRQRTSVPTEDDNICQIYWDKIPN